MFYQNKHPCRIFPFRSRVSKQSLILTSLVYLHCEQVYDDGFLVLGECASAPCSVTKQNYSTLPIIIYFCLVLFSSSSHMPISFHRLTYTISLTCSRHESKRRYLIYFTRHVSRITFIRYAQFRTFGIPQKCKSICEQ